MEFRAIHRYADMGARKIRPFAALIRNRSADEALELLRFLPNKSARLLEGVIKSALGNAEDRGARAIEDHGERITRGARGRAQEIAERPAACFQAHHLSRAELWRASDHVVAVDEPSHDASIVRLARYNAAR